MVFGLWSPTPFCVKPEMSSSMGWVAEVERWRDPPLACEQVSRKANTEPARLLGAETSAALSRATRQERLQLEAMNG